jgi:hypothetical protein
MSPLAVTQEEACRLLSWLVGYLAAAIDCYRFLSVLGFTKQSARYQAIVWPLAYTFWMLMHLYSCLLNRRHTDDQHSL